MQNKGISTLLVLLIVLGVALIGSGVVYYYVTTTPQQDSVACTMEAEICPDGSTVGRAGPNCEFAECPDQTAGWKIYTNNDYGFEFEYPSTKIKVGQIAGSVLGTVENPINGICVGNLVFVATNNNEVLKIAEDYWKTSQSCEEEEIANPNVDISAVNCYGEGGPAFYAFIRGEKVNLFIDGFSGGWTQSGSAGGCSYEQIPDSEYIKILSTFKFTK